jgi:hypothetical protein
LIVFSTEKLKTAKIEFKYVSRGKSTPLKLGISTEIFL